jgi:hypothetical protein
MRSPEDIGAGAIDERRQKPDRRHRSRRKIFRYARTIWRNGDSCDCLVYNLSETGAQLQVSGPIPNVFDLLVEGARSRQSCSVIWRREDRVGVKFEQQADLAEFVRIPVKKNVDFKRYMEACRTLAGRVHSSDRELLLEMADAWATAIRRMRKNAR